MAYAICECGKEMIINGECGIDHYTQVSDGKKIPRIPSTDYRICHDCNCAPGKLHHINCDMEECPLCHGQFISCACLDIEL